MAKEPSRKTDLNPFRRPVFVADAMLGKLTRWLRLLGAKVFFSESKNGDEAIKRAMKEKAVLLTRNEALAAKAGDYAQTMLFKTNDSFQQLRTVMKKFGLKAESSPSFALCPKCGGKIKRIAKAKVKRKVFPRVFKQQKRFWECGQCKQIYWKGSHYARIGDRLKKLNNTLRNRNSCTKRIAAR